MIDTNSILQVASQVAAAQTAAHEVLTALNAQRSQLAPWLPAIAIAAAWLGRELTRFSAWLQTAAGKIIAHGGLVKILIKLFWNPDASPSSSSK
jgi:hypothetical protein